jgi:hypothetical protein
MADSRLVIGCGAFRLRGPDLPVEMFFAFLCCGTWVLCASVCGGGLRWCDCCWLFLFARSVASFFFCETGSHSNDIGRLKSNKIQ